MRVGRLSSDAARQNRLISAAQSRFDRPFRLGANGHLPTEEEPIPSINLALVPVGLASLADELGRIWQQPPDPHVLVGLSTLLVAAGGNLQLAIPGGDRAPALDWFVLVGPSGSGKSPIMEMLIEPLRMRQEQWTAEYRSAMKDYRDRVKLGGAAAVNLQRPALKALLFDDSTYEAMTIDLSESTGGSLWYSDELLGLFNSLDAYKARGGRSMQGLLSMWRAGAIRRRRVKDGELTIVDRPVLSILGGIQPNKLHELGSNDDGRLSRMLVMPVEQGENPTGEPREELKARWARLVQEILDSRPGTLQTIGLDAEAWQAWVDRAGRVMDWARGLAEEDREQAITFVSKLPQHVARIAVALWSGWHERAWPLPAMDTDCVAAAWEIGSILLQHQLRTFGPAAARTGLREDQVRMADEVERFHAWLTGKFNSPVPRREVQMHCKTWRGGLFGTVVEEWRKKGYGRTVSEGRMRLLEWDD